MQKTILITGSTDGIGFQTARSLASRGHCVLLHGRSQARLEASQQAIQSEFADARTETFLADLSSMTDVEALAAAVIQQHESLDVLINNAGVFAVRNPITASGLDLRFVVNTIAPWLLTKRLLSHIPANGRVINLSSAAQTPVDLDALTGQRQLSDGEAYAQSKLAITMWSRELATSLQPEGPVIVAVNPGSFLGSKMVQEAYGREGKDLQIGARILTLAALDDEFAAASGLYFDNDAGRFASPHPDALDPTRTAAVVQTIESLLS